MINDAIFQRVLWAARLLLYYSFFFLEFLIFFNPISFITDANGKGLANKNNLANQKKKQKTGKKLASPISQLPQDPRAYPIT